MTEVALAVGLRQPAPVQRRLPRAVRPAAGQRCGAARRGRQDSAVTLTLPFRPPYDWDAMLGFLAARAIAGVERVEAGCYARTIALDGAQGSIAVRRADAGGRAGGDDPLSAHRVAAAHRRADPPDVRSRRRSRRHRRALSRAIRAWRPLSPRGPACACRAPGTGSSSRCAPSSASRSRVAAATRLAGKLVVALRRAAARRAMTASTALFPRRSSSRRCRLSPRSACRAAAAPAITRARGGRAGRSAPVRARRGAR